MRVLYTIETTEGATTAVDDAKIFSSPHEIAVSKKEGRLIEVCSELLRLIEELPKDYNPMYPAVKTVLEKFKNTEETAPSEEPKKQPQKQTDEEKKKQKKREYMQEYYQRPEIAERKREYMREYMKKYLQRPEIAERNKQRAKAWRAKKKAEAAV